MFEASKGVHEGYAIIALEGAGQKVCILPENGLNLYSWTVDGREIMMEPGDFSLFGTKYGIPLLFPMPNRVKDSVYRWEGRDYVLQKRGVKIARHGLVCDEPFTVTAMGAEDDKAYVTAEIEIVPGNALYEGYPFACLLCVTYTLTENGVRMDAHIENRGEQTMPFGFAAHPYFTKRGDASRCFIKAPLHRYYETDENLIPTGRILPAEGDMAVCGEYHSVESLNLDTVFRGMTADLSAHIRWEDLEIAITSSDCFRNAVIFTPKTKPGFCFEPQTCATNFVNLHAQGLCDESGLIALPAHRSFDCAIDYTILNR